jgi:hypothetical protein
MGGQRRDNSMRQGASRLPAWDNSWDNRRPRYQSDSLARETYHDEPEDYAYEDEALPPLDPPAGVGRRGAGGGRNPMARPAFPLDDNRDGVAGEDISWLTGQRPAPPPSRTGQQRTARRATGQQPLPNPSAQRGELGWERPSAQPPRGGYGYRDADWAPPPAMTGRQPTPTPRGPTRAQPLAKAERIAPSAVAPVVVVPASGGGHLLPLRLRSGFARTGAVLGAVGRRPALLSVVVLVVVMLGVLADVTGAAQEAGQFSASAWRGLAGLMPWSGPAPLDAALQDYDVQHYMDKYGFFKPGAATAIPGWETQNLVQMAGPNIRATAAYDKRYHQSIEPQLVMFWTHAEGIRGRISYSNCANQDQGGYFTVIQNCDHANFWQLGYGNQFSEIYILKNAFADLYGDPNDRQAVQKVGQGVLDFDRKGGTTPACGGYSCTFPAKTMDEILSGVNLTTGVVAEGNWWASVLSRDPAINCYMIAHALTYFNHEATKRWVGCYYQASCWQRISDRLGDVLAAWPDILKTAGIK